MRGRGSKPALPRSICQPWRRPPCGGVDRNYPLADAVADAAVAPHAGAWIETLPCLKMRLALGSPPMRGRGSKQRRQIVSAGVIGRPPCGGVDRNLWCAAQMAHALVAPHAGAWIETLMV